MSDRASRMTREARGAGLGSVARRGEPTELEIRRWLVEHIAESLGLPLDAIDEDAMFEHYGMDSLQAALIAGEIETWLQREVSPVVVWEYASIALLARYLAGDSACAADD